MTFRIARHADGFERMPQLFDETQQREPVVDLASILRVTADDERATDPRRPATLEQCRQVRPVADHVCRQVRGRRMPECDQPFAQLDRRLDPVRGRCRDGHVCAGRQ